MADGARPCGDLALTFGGRRPGRARLGSRWAPLQAGPSWQLWATEPTEAWAGYGCRHEADDDGLRVVLGHEPEHWLRFRWVRATDRWTVRTDQFATIHAYAAPGIVSTFSPSTWGDDPPLDWLAVAGFVRFGWYPGDRMPVEGVCLLRPATDHHWTGDGTAAGRRRWWDWAHDPAPTDVETAGRRLGEVLGAVLAEEVGAGRTALPISGGLDSRTTVAAIDPDPGRLWAYSYGYEAASPELRIARQVADARGLPLREEVIGPRLGDDLDRLVGATEGLVDLTLCRQATVADALRADADGVIAAHWGDVWFGAPAPALGAGAGDALLAAATKRGHQWLTEHLVRPHLGHDPDGPLHDLLAGEAAAVSGVADPTVRLLALKTEQWSLRWTQSTLRAFQMAVPPRLPYYDPRVAELALSLPADLLHGRRTQIEYLRDHAPDLARIEWQAVETDLFRLRHERTWRLPRRVARRLWRTVRPPRARLRNWEVQLLDGEGPALVDRWLVEAGAGLHDLVEQDAVRALVADHRARPTDPGLGYAVATLLTLAAWREQLT